MSSFALIVTLNSARLRLVTLFCPVYRNPTQLRHDFFLPIIHGLIRPTAYKHIFKILVHFTCQSRQKFSSKFLDSGKLVAMSNF